MKIYTLDEILSDKSPSPEPIIGEGILLPQTQLLINGDEKSRKTFLAYNLGLALKAGKSFAGFEINQSHKVLMFSAEGGYYPNRERIQQMCNHIELNDKKDFHLCFDAKFKLDSEEGYLLIQEKIVEFIPDILILDPFIKFHHADENSSRDIIKVLERIRELIEEFNHSTIIVHHNGKNSYLGPRGSSAILGEYDSNISLAYADKIPNLNHIIKFDLRHAVSPEPRRLVFNDITNWFEESISPVVKIVKELGTISRKDCMNKCLDRKLYETDGGAYKRIAKEIRMGNLIIDSNDMINLPPTSTV